MPSVQPVTVSDLNGIEFNPGEIILEDVAGYVGYVRNLCTDLGTERDTKEGYQSFLNFQAEIKNSVIETFEPEVVDESHSFETIDLNGPSGPIREYPLMTYYAVKNNQLLYSYEKLVTPFNLPPEGDPIPTRFVTPFDLDNFEENMINASSDDEIDLS